MTIAHMPKIYAISRNDVSYFGKPVYLIRDGKFFRTSDHYWGWSENPDYELRNDGKIYRTAYHPKGKGNEPDYEFHTDRKLYRTSAHPDSNQGVADFEIKD